MTTLFLSVLTLAFGAEITLSPEAHVRGTEIRLGDIAEISGTAEEIEELSGFSLGYAPSPGYVRILRGWRIEQTVERELPGVDVRLSGSPAVRVHPVTAVIDPQALAEVARAELAVRLENEEATFELEGTLAGIEVPAGSTAPTLEARASNVRAAAGLATVPVRVLVDGELYRTVYTQWRVRLWETRPVLLRDVKAGEVIDLRAVENQRVPLGSSRIGEAVPAGLLIGSVAARDLAQGETVDQQDVRRPTLIEAGDMVFIVIRKGPISARVPVTAHEQGSLGDRIRVHTSAERELMATVIARNLVELDLTTPR